MGGDINMNMGSNRQDPIMSTLNQLLNELNLCNAECKLAGDIDSTFFNPATGAKSFIDHFFCCKKYVKLHYKLIIDKNIFDGGNNLSDNHPKIIMKLEMSKTSELKINSYASKSYNTDHLKRDKSDLNS